MTTTVGLIAGAVFAVSGSLLPVGEIPAGIRTIGVVMPASVLDRAHFDASVESVKKMGFQVKPARRLSFDSRASLADRVADFEEIWLDPEVDLVMCARGGVGCEEIVERLDWSKLAKRPDQRIVGFSNVTVLLNAMLKRGIGRPYSGPNFGTLGTCEGDTLSWLFRALGGGFLPETRLQPIKAGPFSGMPCGGHIGLVGKCIDSGWLPDVSNRVVFLERNGSTTVAGIRRELDAIAASGCLGCAAGVIFGDVTPGMADNGEDWGNMKPYEDPEELRRARNDVQRVKADFARKVRCPVYDGFVYGHTPVMHTIDFKRTVRVSADGVMSWD